LIIKAWDHDTLKDDCIGKIKIKSIEVGIGNISISFRMVKEGVTFGGTLNLKVTKGHNLKPPKKVKALKVRGKVNVDIGGKGKSSIDIKIRGDVKVKGLKVRRKIDVEIEGKVKELKVKREVEIDVKGKRTKSWKLKLTLMKRQKKQKLDVKLK